jgi:hypothetical protein
MNDAPWECRAGLKFLKGTTGLVYLLCPRVLMGRNVCVEGYATGRKRQVGSKLTHRVLLALSRTCAPDTATCA